MAVPLDPRTETIAGAGHATTARSSAREPARFDSILRPIRAFRLNYVPVVMVYFAYGALGLIDVTRDLWIKESLSFTPSQLAGIARLADPALDREDGVRRARGHRADLRLAAESLHPDRRRVDGRGPGHPRRRRRPLARLCSRADHLYVLGAMLVAIGTVVQDVVADAMSTEVVRAPTPPATSGPTTTCASSSAWCRCSAGSRSRPASSRSPASRDGSPISCRARTFS